MVPISSIILLGEFTTEDGPYADDHLLAFWLDDGRTIELPVNTPGAPQIIDKVAHTSGGTSRVELTLNTSFASRVLYPPKYAGENLFDFKKGRSGLAGLLFNNVIERSLTPSLAAFVDTKLSRPLPPPAR